MQNSQRQNTDDDTVVSSNGTLGKKKKKKAKWPGLKYEVSVPRSRHVYQPNISLSEQLQLLDSVIIDDKDPRQATALPRTSIYCFSNDEKIEVSRLLPELAASKIQDNENPQDRNSTKSPVISTLTISLENDLHKTGPEERLKHEDISVNPDDGDDRDIMCKQLQHNEEKGPQVKSVRMEVRTHDRADDRCPQVDSSQDKGKNAIFDTHKVHSWITASQQYFPESSHDESESESCQDDSPVTSSDLYTETLVEKNDESSPPVTKRARIVTTNMSSEILPSAPCGLPNKHEKENYCLTNDTIKHVLKGFVYDEENLLEMKPRALVQTHMGKLSSTAQKLASNSDAVEAVFSALHKTRDELSKTLTEEVNQSAPSPIQIKRQPLKAPQPLPDTKDNNDTALSRNDPLPDSMQSKSKRSQIEDNFVDNLLEKEQPHVERTSRRLNTNRAKTLDDVTAQTFRNVGRSSENKKAESMEESLPEILETQNMDMSPETYCRININQLPEKHQMPGLNQLSEKQPRQNMDRRAGKWESMDAFPDNHQSVDRTGIKHQRRINSPSENLKWGMIENHVDKADHSQESEPRNKTPSHISDSTRHGRWSATREKLHSISANAVERGIGKDPCRRTIDKIVKQKRRGMLKGLNNLYRGKPLEYSEVSLDEEFHHLEGLSLGTQLECTFTSESNMVKRAHYDVLKEWITRKPLDSYIVGKFDVSDLNVDPIQPSLKIDETVQECLTEFKDDVFDLLKIEDITMHQSNVFPTPRNDTEDTVGKVFRQVHQYMDFVVSQAEQSNRTGVTLNGYSKLPGPGASPVLNTDRICSLSSSEGELHEVYEEDGRGHKSSRAKHKHKKKKRKHKKSKSPEKRKRFQVVEYPSTGEDSDVSELPSSKRKHAGLPKDCYKPTNAPTKKKISTGSPPKGISAQGMTHIMDEFYGDVEDLFNSSDMSVDGTGAGDQHLPPLKGPLTDTSCKDRCVDSVINEEMTKTEQHLLDILVPNLINKDTKESLISPKQTNSGANCIPILTLKNEDFHNKQIGGNKEGQFSSIKPSKEKTEISANQVEEFSSDANIVESTLAPCDRIQMSSCLEGNNTADTLQLDGKDVKKSHASYPCASNTATDQAQITETEVIERSTISRRPMQRTDKLQSVSHRDQTKIMTARHVSQNRRLSHHRNTKRKHSPPLPSRNRSSRSLRHLAQRAVSSAVTLKVDAAYSDSFSSTLGDAYSNTPVSNFEPFFDVTKAPEGHFKNPYNQWWSIMQYFLDETRETTDMEYLQKWLPRWENVVASGIVPENSFLLALSFATNRKLYIHSVDKQIGTDDALEFDDVGGDINEYGSVPGSSDTKRSRTLSTNSSSPTSEVTTDATNMDDGSRTSSKKATPKRVNTLALAFRQAVEAKKMAGQKQVSTKVSFIPLVRKMKIKGNLRSKSNTPLTKVDTKISSQKTPEAIKDLQPIPYGETKSMKLIDTMVPDMVTVPPNVCFEPKLNKRIQSVMAETMEDFVSNIKDMVTKSLGQQNWNQTKLPSNIFSPPSEIRHLSSLSDQAMALFDETREQNKQEWTVSKSSVAVQTDCSKLPQKKMVPQQMLGTSKPTQSEAGRRKGDTGDVASMKEAGNDLGRDGTKSPIYPDISEKNTTLAANQERKEESEGNNANQVVGLESKSLIGPLPRSQSLLPISVGFPEIVCVVPTMVPHPVRSAIMRRQLSGQISDSEPVPRVVENPLVTPVLGPLPAPFAPEPTELQQIETIAPIVTSVSPPMQSKGAGENPETATEMPDSSVDQSTSSLCPEEDVKGNALEGLPTAKNTQVVGAFTAIEPLPESANTKNVPTIKFSLSKSTTNWPKSTSNTVPTVSSTVTAQPKPVNVSAVDSTQIPCLAMDTVSSPNTTGDTVLSVIDAVPSGSAELSSPALNVTTSSPTSTSDSAGLLSTGSSGLTDSVVTSTSTSVTTSTTVTTSSQVSTATTLSKYITVSTDGPKSNTQSSTESASSTAASVSTPVGEVDLPVVEEQWEAAVEPSPPSITRIAAIGLVSLEPMEIPGFGSPEEASPTALIPKRQYPIVTREPDAMKPTSPVNPTGDGGVVPVVGAPVPCSSSTDAGAPTSISLDAIPLPPSGKVTTDSKASVGSKVSKWQEWKKHQVRPTQSEPLLPDPSNQLKTLPSQAGGEWCKHVEPAPPISTLTEWPLKSASDPLPPPPLPPIIQSEWTANLKQKQKDEQRPPPQSLQHPPPQLLQQLPPSLQQPPPSLQQLPPPLPPLQVPLPPLQHPLPPLQQPPPSLQQPPPSLQQQQQYGGWYGEAQFQQPWSAGWGQRPPPPSDWGGGWQGGHQWGAAPWGHPRPRGRGPWEQHPGQGAFWNQQQHKLPRPGPPHPQQQQQQRLPPPPQWGAGDQQQGNNHPGNSHQGGDWGGQQFNQPKRWEEKEWATQKQPSQSQPQAQTQPQRQAQSQTPQTQSQSHPQTQPHSQTQRQAQPQSRPEGSMYPQQHPPPPGFGPLQGPVPRQPPPNHNQTEDRALLPLPPPDMAPPHEEKPGEWEPPALPLLALAPGEDSSLPVTLGVGRAYERPQPAQNIRMLVFNPDQPICKSVQRFLTFLGAKTFDPFNVSALKAMHGIETLVLIHVEDVPNIHQVPNLLALKTQEWVTFVTYESVTDVQHKKYSVILKSGGIAVPDDMTLLSLHPDSLETICEFMVQQQRDGNEPWYLAVHSHLLSQLLNAR